MTKVLTNGQLLVQARRLKHDAELATNFLCLPTYIAAEYGDDFAAAVGADQPPALIERINAKLFYGGMPAELKTEIQGAIEKMAIPTLRTDASNQTQVTNAKRARVNAAIFLAVISPEFQVQK